MRILRQLFSAGGDTVTIRRDGSNLYYKIEDTEFLLAAGDHTHFFDLKNDLAITFTGNLSLRPRV